MSTDVSEVRAASIIRAISEPSARGSRLYKSPEDWVDQSGMRDDRLGIGPVAGGWAVQSRRERERDIVR
jgi:hypothetical protein